MYRRYKIDNIPVSDYEDLDSIIGEGIIEQYSETLKTDLNKYLINDETLDADKIMEEWFPQIDVDIFLSHSHSNIKEVKTFAGWLYRNFNLKAFVDSTVWGYADDLLRQVDNNFCLDDKQSKLYNYEKRNISTSNVHMMLMSSLARMIDKCECFMLIDTPEAVHISDTFEKTYSPWIYEELTMSRIIKISPIGRKTGRILIREGEFTKAFDSTINIQVEYPAGTEHLTSLSTQDLYRWQHLYSDNDEYNPLDILYGMK